VSQPNRPRLSPAEFAARYPAKASRYTPVVISTAPGVRPNLLAVTVSLAPGELVTVQVNAVHYATEGMAAILLMLPSIYRSLGLDADLTTRGDT